MIRTSYLIEFVKTITFGDVPRLIRPVFARGRQHFAEHELGMCGKPKIRSGNRTTLPEFRFAIGRATVHLTLPIILAYVFVNPQKKISKIGATICQIIRLQCTKKRFPLGLCLRPRLGGGVYSTPQAYHRLNGSSSPVLMANCLSYGSH